MYTYIIVHFSFNLYPGKQSNQKIIKSVNKSIDIAYINIYLYINYNTAGHVLAQVHCVRECSFEKCLGGGGGGGKWGPSPHGIHVAPPKSNAEFTSPPPLDKITTQALWFYIDHLRM